MPFHHSYLTNHHYLDILPRFRSPGILARSCVCVRPMLNYSTAKQFWQLLSFYTLNCLHSLTPEPGHVNGKCAAASPDCFMVSKISKQLRRCTFLYFRLCSMIMPSLTLRLGQSSNLCSNCTSYHEMWVTGSNFTKFDLSFTWPTVSFL